MELFSGIPAWYGRRATATLFHGRNFEGKKILESRLHRIGNAGICGQARVSRLNWWQPTRCPYGRFAIRIIAATLRSTSASVVAQQETLMRMAVRPCQTVTPHQQVPSS